MKSQSGVPAAHHRRRFRFGLPGKAAVILCFLMGALALPFQLSAREKDAIQYGAGLIINVPFPENEVTQVVQDVAQNGIIRGTKEYNKDEYISGATPATSIRVFKEWTEGGKVFYKVRLKALDPLNFKNGNDVGTLAVRYIVQPQGDKNSVLRIDAVFVEDFRHVTHLSNGSVESAEYKDIHDRLDAIDSMKAQTIELEKEKQARLAAKDHPTSPALADESSSSSSSSSSASVAHAAPVAAPAPVATPTEEVPATADASPSARPQTLEEHVAELRRQVERLVKAPGAPLKSAPFHTASTLQSLPAGSDVLIVITTPYWVGVETRDGQHGWILRDQLELLP